MNELTMIPVGLLYPHPNNPRKDVGDVTELAESIKANGVMQNLTVVRGHYLSAEERSSIEALQDSADPDPVIEGILKRGRQEDGFTVIIGHRRLAAAKLAGLEELPCSVVSLTEKQQLSTMLVENMQRTDLTVFEEAQGFQLMLDMGESVEEIAKLSGFSETTVRRRVKMMELDQKTLREVSARQLSMADFDRLAKIKDVQERNKCLEKIGTFDFNMAVQQAMKRQGVKENLPKAKAWLKQHKAKGIKESETYGSKYEHVGEFSYSLDRWAEDKMPKRLPKELFYYLDAHWGTLKLFKKKEKAAAVQKSPEEREKARRIAQAWEQLDELGALTRRLRREFIQGLTVTKKNREAVLRGALTAAAVNAATYSYPDREEVIRCLGMDAGGSQKGKETYDAVSALDEQQMPRLVYAMFGEDDKERFSRGYGRSELPKYEFRSQTAALYSWLESLGYQLSDAEHELLEGTHPVFGGENRGEE